MPPLTPAERKARSRAKANLMKVAQGTGGVDRVAEVVHAQVLAKLHTGELQVTVKDGLAADKIIRSEASKTDDRKTLIALAFLQGGGRPPDHLLIDDGKTVDGDFTVIEDE